MTAVLPTVPFLDLDHVNGQVRAELDAAWRGVLAHGGFIGGPEVSRFEAEFARFCGVEHCVGVANGTDALELVLAALGIGRGDEVVVPANTFVATAEAVAAVGAHPRFVDVRPDTLLVDPDAVADAVGPATAAVIGVHLYGQMADTDRLTAVAERYGLAYLEDAAQAHGADDLGRRAGSTGVAAAFSFYPGKNLGALGDGGAVTTRDAALADRVRRLGNHGRSARDRHSHTDRGRNSRLDTLQAAVLSAKLPRLDEQNDARRAAARAYRDLLPETCTPVAVRAGARSVHHLAVVQVADRARAADALTRAGIGWGVHYPVPCHRQPAFAPPGGAAGPPVLPVTEAAADRILSLPMSPSLRAADVAAVCDVLRVAL